MKLYYNASHPLEILDSLTIKTSFVTRDRGVSMSSQQLDCHGPFTFVFKEDRPWYSQFSQVKYGVFEQQDFLHKIEAFQNEHEWWSAKCVQFMLEDVERIVFRSQSPGVRIHPRIAVRNFKELTKRYGKLIGDSHEGS